MNDATYLAVRGLNDDNGRPLLSVRDDQELLLGKLIRISPSVPDIAAGATPVVFGDLKSYVVRRTPFRLQRSVEVPGYAEYGIALINAWQRVDAKLLVAGSARPSEIP